VKFGNEYLPRKNVPLWTYTKLNPMEHMSMLAGVLFDCPVVAYLRCLLAVPLTTVGARVKSDTCHNTVAGFLLPNRHCI